MRVRCLSFHANYGCRNSGHCCTADWPIPDDNGGLLPRTERGCAFHNADAHRCEIHAAHGHDALPLACRQFPRVTLTDPRGVCVALSCYCPTALSMLETFSGPIAIVDDPPAFPPHGEYVGLDARTSLPPALCPNVLMDWDSWWEWERLSVDLCNLEETPRQILARLLVAVEHARTWRPGQGELLERVQEAHSLARTADARELRSGLNSSNRVPISCSVAQELRHRRLVASHAFASWTAQLGGGLRTWLRSLETIVCLREIGWTISEIDLWLRHFADPRLLAKVWSVAERD